MTTQYHPFGNPVLLTVAIDEYQTQDGYWNLGAKCVQNELGDLARFVYREATLQGVATPMEDVGTPVAPLTGHEGTSRVQEILIRFANGKEQYLDETKNGILAALDEYVRSKILFRDHMAPAETFYFSDIP
jgi:hypothetical protein